ncbi:type IV secretory system conjugative DNA transfer family protein [Ohtaekwangia kribbensis]|uniref:Type IV secretory system conjugative DNA transfer family protein n=1 Tax=Ohtaekwangia kribbensis TaxID=688913 RepID=A0ABW3K2H2_9BACT
MITFDPETPLLTLGNNLNNDIWTIRHAFEGVQIFGGIGSGKTSGSGRTIALKFLKAKFGGLVLTAKADEKKDWIEYCRLTGRLNDLVIIEPGGKEFFNFLEYESAPRGGETSITGNIVHVLKTVLKASEEKDKGKSDDAFWENAVDLLIYNIVDLCSLAYGFSTIQHIYEIAQSVPRSLDELKNPDSADKAFVKALVLADKKVKEKLREWERGLTPEQLSEMERNGTSSERAAIEVPAFRLISNVEEFFKANYISLNEKTRSIIEFSLVGFLFRFMRDPVFTLFCDRTSTIKPDDCLNGKIILINLPVKLYDKVGRDAQIMFKYIWQRAMERRDIKVNDRPIFLFADEAHIFLHEYDADYQATARSSRICTVYISQNLPNYYANMGGGKAEYRVKSFLGTLNTKIFHANADIETNNYSSSLMGDAEYIRTSVADTGPSLSRTKTISTKSERIIRSEEFVKLKTGGPRNAFVVECYIHRQGDSFSNEENYIKAKFNQNFIPT